MGRSARYACLAGISPRPMRQGDVDHRSELRVSCKDAVAIIFRGSHHLVPVLNRSKRGLMVKLTVRPRIGETMLVVFRGGQSQEGVVCWFHAGKAGIKLF